MSEATGTTGDGTLFRAKFRVVKTTSGNPPTEVEYRLSNWAQDRWEKLTHMVEYGGVVKLTIDMGTTNPPALLSDAEQEGVRRVMSFLAEQYANRIASDMTCLQPVSSPAQPSGG